MEGISKMLHSWPNKRRKHLHFLPIPFDTFHFLQDSNEDKQLELRHNMLWPTDVWWWHWQAAKGRAHMHKDKHRKDLEKQHLYLSVTAPPFTFTLPFPHFSRHLRCVYRHVRSVLSNLPLLILVSIHSVPYIQRVILLISSHRAHSSLAWSKGLTRSHRKQKRLGRKAWEKEWERAAISQE